VDEIQREVEALIDRGEPEDPRAVEALLFAIAQAQGMVSQTEDPAWNAATELCGLDRIDPVPEAAFKWMTVAHFPPSEAERVFHTSGTTQGTPGRHWIRDMGLYRRSVLRGFERFVLYPPRPTRFVSLIPDISERPHSSLAWMVHFVREAFFERALEVRRADRLDLDRLLAVLRDCVADAEPVLLMGTTLDFLTLMEGWPERTRFALPPGSRVVHTGGVKASGRVLRYEDLWESLERTFGIPREDVVEEYGMTELLSQAYDAPRVTRGARRLVPVPWMRVRVLDPVTFQDVRPGARGLLCHYDLANLWTAVAILTQDLAERVEDGFARVERAPGATPRGCSHDAAIET